MPQSPTSCSPPTDRHTQSPGMDRRSFFKAVAQIAASVGLSAATANRIAEAAVRGKKPTVIWLHFQDCTGCTESLLRSSQPGFAELVLDLISLDYHETVMAAAGHQAEEALNASIKTNAGKYILVVEGAIPLANNGNFIRIAGRTGVQMLKDVAAGAGLVIAIGSCASWGGLPSADPNPTGAVGAHHVLTGSRIVNLPGCPANPNIFLATALQFATLGTLPELDAENRPKFAYGRLIHDHCPRRAHFDAGRFADQFGDAGHRLGHCLYKLGCKGPATHANCSTNSFCEVVDAWPIGLGHPCFGCTEKSLAFRVPMFQTVNIERVKPPEFYPGLTAHYSSVSAAATGLAGLVAGGAIAGALRLSKKVEETAAETDSNPPDGGAR
uniref:Hydrogenase (NiFe) small subunit HydA n=1 Tax=Solibacter usitatus (strain Ellin6076) TaxID=234267 RepID=Q01R84_SOLUE